MRTTFLLAAMTVFLVFLGNLLGGRQGMIFALILAAGWIKRENPSGFIIFSGE